MSVTVVAREILLWYSKNSFRYGNKIRDNVILVPWKNVSVVENNKQWRKTKLSLNTATYLQIDVTDSCRSVFSSHLIFSKLSQSLPFSTPRYRSEVPTTMQANKWSLSLFPRISSYKKNISQFLHPPPIILYSVNSEMWSQTVSVSKNVKGYYIIKRSLIGPGDDYFFHAFLARVR